MKPIHRDITGIIHSSILLVLSSWAFWAWLFIRLVDIETFMDRNDTPTEMMGRRNRPTEPGVMQNAAERLLGLKLSDIQDLAKDIILGQLRLVIALMDIEEINTDRDKFLEAFRVNVEASSRR